MELCVAQITENSLILVMLAEAHATSAKAAQFKAVVIHAKLAV